VQPAAPVEVPCGRAARRTAIATPRLLIGLAALAVTACAGERGRDPFTATGELVALSGGDAGARRACIVCHGLDGAGDGEMTPRLAGLPEGYLVKQLQDYADGRRAHPDMEGIAKALDPRARQAVAAYYARLPWAPPPTVVVQESAAARLYHEGDPARGLAPCATCHGRRGEGGGAANPPLAGQPAGYLEAQFARWRDSARRNDPQNMMLAISRRVTPAEAAALARYCRSLPGAPATTAGAGSAAPAASP